MPKVGLRTAPPLHGPCVSRSHGELGASRLPYGSTLWMKEVCTALIMSNRLTNTLHHDWMKTIGIKKLDFLCDISSLESAEYRLTFLNPVFLSTCVSQLTPANFRREKAYRSAPWSGVRCHIFQFNTFIIGFNNSVKGQSRLFEFYFEWRNKHIWIIHKSRNIIHIQNFRLCKGLICWCTTDKSEIILQVL